MCHYICQMHLCHLCEIVHKGGFLLNKIKLQQKLKEFLLEDIGSRDITSQSIFPQHELGVATLLVKQDGILSGVDIVVEAYKILADDIEVTLLKQDGDIIC